MTRQLESHGSVRPLEKARLTIAATGYLSSSAGSVAGANALVLRAMLARGHRITFHSKPSFVDPRPIVAGCQAETSFSFVDCTNGLPDRLFRSAGGLGRWGSPLKRVLGGWDDRSYRRHVADAIASTLGETDRTGVAHWMGTWAYRRVPGALNVSSPQGAPGTDARSLERHRDTILRLTSRRYYAALRAYSQWRLGSGLPPFDQSDCVIVGSSWSQQALCELYGLPSDRVESLPYPIDLEHFQPSDQPRETSGPLRLLWVGRFAPRKRLDLFLDGAAAALRAGTDVELTVVGRSAFVPNYEKLLQEFRFQDRLKHLPRVDRSAMPQLMAANDVLCQPSDEEDFGSSVAEALACGMPAIVGATNGTGDYVCARSVRLADDRVDTYAESLASLAAAKRSGSLADPGPSRAAAERHFAIDSVAARLEAILTGAAGGTR